MCQRDRNKRAAALMALPAAMAPALMLALKAMNAPDTLIGAILGVAIGLALVGLVRLRRGKG